MADKWNRDEDELSGAGEEELRGVARGEDDEFDAAEDLDEEDMDDEDEGSSTF